MTKEQMLLTILAEECNEIAQRCTKAIRFGIEEVQPGQLLNNGERIDYEWNDLYATLMILTEEGVFNFHVDRSMIEAKKVKVRNYMELSKQLGTLT